jgi:hypothetical protein
LVIQPIASHYTDYAILALNHKTGKEEKSRHGENGLKNEVKKIGKAGKELIKVHLAFTNIEKAYNDIDKKFGNCCHMLVTRHRVLIEHL